MFQIGLKWNWPLFSQPQRLVEQRRKFHCRVIARLWGEFTTDTDPQKLWTSIAFQNKQLEPVFNLAQGGPRLGFLLANLISEPRTNSPEWVLVISSALTRWLIRIWAFVVLGHILGGHCVIPCSTSLLRFCLQSFFFFLPPPFFFFRSFWLLSHEEEIWLATDFSPSLYFLCWLTLGGQTPLSLVFVLSTLAGSWVPREAPHTHPYPLPLPLPLFAQSSSPLSPSLLTRCLIKTQERLRFNFSAQIHEIISSPLPLFFSAS